MDYVNSGNEITYNKLKRLHKADKEARKKTGEGLTYWDLLHIFGNKLWDFTDNGIEIVDGHERIISMGDNINLDLKFQTKNILLTALEQTKWSQKDAAKLMGITSRQINYLINKFKITHSNWRVNIKQGD